VRGALIASSAITIVPMDVSMVAVYRFVTSMPMSGSEGNFWVFGADPSSGGKGKLMTSTLQASAPWATEQLRWLS
jgi:hypothetical protein